MTMVNAVNTALDQYTEQPLRGVLLCPPPTKCGTLSDAVVGPSVCPSVCLSHAHSSKAVRCSCRATVTIEHLVLELRVSPIRRFGRVATRSGQNIFEAEKFHVVNISKKQVRYVMVTSFRYLAVITTKHE